MELEDADLRHNGQLAKEIKNWINGEDILSPPDRSSKRLRPSKRPRISSSSAKMIDIHEAAKHYNEDILVASKVYGFKDFGSMVLVNLGDQYPNQLLTLVLRGNAKAIAQQLDGKIITVRGKVVEYKGKPEIEVTETDQIKIK